MSNGEITINPSPEPAVVPDDRANGKTLIDLLEPQSYSKAKKACEDMGTTLAVVESAAQNGVLLQQLYDAGAPNAWIGLDDLATEGSFLWVDGTPLGAYKNWLENQPTDVHHEKEDCVVVGVWGSKANPDARDGQWNDQPCEEDDERYALCQKVEETTPKIVHVPGKMTYDEGQAACVAAGTAGLMVVRSQEQNDAMRQVMYEKGIPNAWIGYSDREQENSWKWRDNSNDGYENWKDPPSYGKYHEMEDCAVIGLWGNKDRKRPEDGMWNDIKCEDNSDGGAFCEGDPVPADNGGGSGETTPPGDASAIDGAGNENGAVIKSDSGMTWQQANAACKSLVPGSSGLVIIKDEAQNIGVRQILYDNNFKNGWIGLNDIEQEGVWMWSDGVNSDTRYKNWAPNQPFDVDKEKEDCAVIGLWGDKANPDSQDGMWNDQPCSTLQYFAICDAPAAPTFSGAAVAKWLVSSTAVALLLVLVANRIAKGKRAAGSVFSEQGYATV